MKRFVTIKIFNSRIEAEIVKGKLEASGIEALIIGGDAGGTYPFPLQPSQGVELKVEEKDVKKAEKILAS